MLQSGKQGNRSRKLKQIKLKHVKRKVSFRQSEKRTLRSRPGFLPQEIEIAISECFGLYWGGTIGWLLSIAYSDNTSNSRLNPFINRLKSSVQNWDTKMIFPSVAKLPGQPKFQVANIIWKRLHKTRIRLGSTAWSSTAWSLENRHMTIGMVIWRF